MNVPQAFAAQARACRDLGSPLTAQLCDALPEALRLEAGPVAGRVLDWPGDAGPSGASVPLRLCGALHALVLTKAAPDLVRAYGARMVPKGLLAAVLRTHGAAILAWLDSPPQTNEVARAAALIAAARFLGDRLPLRLLELGASAGLNLNFDRYDLLPQGAARADQVRLLPEWRGAPPTGSFRVASRRGVDLNPLRADRDGLRLMAYCWADQTDRLARLTAALALARAHPVTVDRGDAGAWLTDQLQVPAEGVLTLVYHTIAAQYFPPSTLLACRDALDRAAAEASPAAPVAHLRMEADGGTGAALDLTLWDGGRRDWSLGRADFHGRWVAWDPTAR